MTRNKRTSQAIKAVAISLTLISLVLGAHANETVPLTVKTPPEANKTLSFPADGWTGNLYLEPESGPGWAPENVALRGEWEYLCAARGDVRVPEDRNVKLNLVLEVGPDESERLRVANPSAYQMLIADRTRKYPKDLSRLSQLDPNDLFWLSVSSPTHRGTDTAPRILGAIRHLTGLQILTLNNAGVTDEDLEHLRPLHSLSGLELTESSIGNQGLAVLKDLPALEYLYLNTGVTDEGLKQVAQASSLRWLRIAGPKAWGPGWAELAHLPRLERLCIMSSRSIANGHIKKLEGLTQLKALTFWSAGDTLTDASLASIGKLENLEELHFIRSSPRFTAAGLVHLKNLKTVNFGQVWAGPAGARYGDSIARQLATFPNLESIRGIGYLSADGMETLAALRHLKCLHVSLKDRGQGYRGPTGLAHLARLTSLEELAISTGDPLSDANLACLEPLTQLKHLVIACESVNAEGLASIGKLRQLEHLELLCVVPRHGLNHLSGLSGLQTLDVSAWDRTATAVSADELQLDLSGLERLKDLNLSGLALQDSDLAFLQHLPLLENLIVLPSTASSLTGASLRYLQGLPELNRLWFGELASSTGEDLAQLNGLPKLRDLRVAGDITDTALASLTGPKHLGTLTVETDEPIGKQTLTRLSATHPAIEYIHINTLTPARTRRTRTPRRATVPQLRPTRPVPTSRRRGRR